MKELATLRGLMIYHLQSLLEAENTWSIALRESAKVISSNKLKKIFENGSRAAAEHAAEIQNMLTEFGATSFDKRNVIADDLAREMDDMRNTAADPEVLDAGLTVTHQCMNHYLIAKYGTVASFADMLDLDNMAPALHKIMVEEKKEDRRLTKLAEKKLNKKARIALIH